MSGTVTRAGTLIGYRVVVSASEEAGSAAGLSLRAAADVLRVRSSFSV